MTSDPTHEQPAPDPFALRDLLATEAPTALPVGEFPRGKEDASLLLPVLLERLDRLAEKFDGKIREDAGREAIVERLHTELQQYKADLLLQMIKPILLDLIAMHDNLGKALEAAAAEAGEGFRQLRQRLEGFRTEVEDALYRQGVEPYVHPGDAFEPRRQQAVKTVPATTPEDEGRIAARLRPGFTRDERILRPERVVVFVKATVRP